MAISLNEAAKALSERWGNVYIPRSTLQSMRQRGIDISDYNAVLSEAGWSNPEPEWYLTAATIEARRTKARKELEARGRKVDWD